MEIADRVRNFGGRMKEAVGNAYDNFNQLYFGDQTPGLRPQDDESMRQLISILKNNSGMGPNGEAIKANLNVDPRAIVRTMLMAPGQTKVYSTTTQPWLNRVINGRSFGTTHQGWTGNTSAINVYPIGDIYDRQNTLLHEGIHAIGNQHGERPARDIDESRAYHGTGALETDSFGNPELGTAPITSKQAVEDYLRMRIGGGQ